MKPTNLRLLLCLLPVLVSVLNTTGQTTTSTASSPTLQVEGAGQKSLALGRADLDGMKQHELRAKDHDGQEHVFKGVLLVDILQKAGATVGGQLRGKNLAQYLLVQARDGYQAVYALPELDPEFTDQVLIVATTKDGRPLSNEEGPFRIIVPHEKKHARWVRQVTILKIMKVQ